METLSRWGETLWLYTGAFFPRNVRLFYSWGVDMADIFLLEVALGGHLLSYFLPGVGWLSAIPLQIVGLLQILAAVMLWGRRGLLVMTENILSVIFGGLPIIGRAIEFLPMATIAAIVAMWREDDRRAMRWAQSRDGRWIQRIAILGSYWYGIVLLPSIWAMTKHIPVIAGILWEALEFMGGLLSWIF